MNADLSIIIPVYNEARRLPATLTAIRDYFAHDPRAVEILIVDDGSSDDSPRIPLPPDRPGLVWRRLHNEGNRGKGYSVRHGMLAASGQYRLFTDADLSAPLSQLPGLEQALRHGADIAIGSRRRRDLIAVHQSWFRENAGRVFNAIVRLGLSLPYADTQCGFKLFNRASALAIFPQQRIERWGFDPELLFLARRFGFRVEEVPVVWSHADGAKIHLFRDSLRMFWDVIEIRRHARLYQAQGRGAHHG